MKILIIEDEYKLADAIKSRLLQEYCEIDIITDGEQGLDAILDNTYDLIILDIMLPHISGLEILESVRNFRVDAKIIMLTAKSTLEDKLTGFSLGADDYLTKPFHMDELVARVNALLKRSQDHEKLSFGNIELHLRDLTVVNCDTGASIEIIGKEFQLFNLLLENKDFILPKEKIFNKIWGIESESSISCVEAYVSFLRKKLRIIGANINIRSVRNTGYKLELHNEKNSK